MPEDPASGLLAIYVHWDGGNSDSNSGAADDEEAIPDTLCGDPIVGVKCQSKSKHVLDEIHDRKGFGRLLTMAVGNVGDDGCGAELNAEIDDSHADDDWNWPGVLVVKRLAPGKEASSGEDEVSDHDW